MNKRTINLKNHFLIFAFLIAFISLPDYIIGGTFRRVVQLYSAIVYAIMIITYIKINKTKFSKLIIFVFFVQLIPLISTIAHKNYDQLYQAFFVFLEMLSVTMFIEYWCKEDFKTFIKDIMIFFGIFVIINVITFFVYYPSMSPKEAYFYFLGNDNGSVYETLTFVMIAMIYSIIYNNKISNILKIIFIFIFAGYIYVQSGNGMGCMFFILFISFFYNSNILKKVCNMKVMIAIYVAVFIMIVILREGSLVKFVLELFGKDYTYSGRTYIWDLCFEHIKNNFWIGNGYEGLILSYSKINQIKAHNFIIQTFYNGGFLTLSLMIIILIKSFKKIALYKEKFSKLYIVLFFSMYFFLIVGLFDYYYAKPTLYIMMALIFGTYEYLSKKEETK